MRKCPRCPKAQGSALKVEMYEDVEIDRCPKCHGVWLDQGELEKVIQREEKKFPQALIQSTLKMSLGGLPQAEIESTELCPVCSAAMKPVNYNYSSGVIVDVCPEGHGMWLDHQEIDKVQAHMEHWNKEAQKRKGEWKKLQADALDLQRQTLKAQDDRIHKILGPIGDLAFMIVKRFNK